MRMVIYLYRSIENGGKDMGKLSEDIGKPSLDVSKPSVDVVKPSVDVGKLGEDTGKLLLLRGITLKNEGKHKEAFAIIEEAAVQYNNVVAQCALGSIYERGIGVGSIDYKESFIWYKRAAEIGNAEAQNSVGCCYELGKGVEENYEEAMH